MFMKRWIAEIESYGGKRVNVRGINPRNPTEVKGQIVTWAIHIWRKDLPPGVGSFYPPLGLLGRLLQPFMFWRYVREVRKAVKSQRNNNV